MIGYLRTRVRKQPIVALYFESENELRFYYLEASMYSKIKNTLEVDPNNQLTVSALVLLTWNGRCIRAEGQYDVICFSEEVLHVPCIRKRTNLC